MRHRRLKGEWNIPNVCPNSIIRICKISLGKFDTSLSSKNMLWTTILINPHSWFSMNACGMAKVLSLMASPGDN